MACSKPTQQLILPETLKNWPWPRRINPHHAAVKAEANHWLHKFNAFNPKAQAAFDAFDFRAYECVDDREVNDNLYSFIRFTGILLARQRQLPVFY